MESSVEDYRELPQLFADKLVTFRAVWFDNRRPEYGYTLSGIYIHVHPPEETTFPFRIPRVFVYFQVWGTPGEYRFQIRLVRLENSDENGDEWEELHLGKNGEPRDFPMPSLRNVEITGLNLVDQVAFGIENVPFDTPGLYEYQLWADGIDEPIARERVRAEE